jgi:hypothetical protein
LIEMPWKDADCRDLVFEPLTLVGPGYPDADAILAPLARHVESRQRPDDPPFKRSDIGTHVGLSPFQVEHDIDHPLAGAVIGELSASPALKDRKAGIEQIGGLAAGA